MYSLLTGKKPVVAVDIDEVLAAFVPGLLKFHNAEYGTTLRVEDFHSYRFCEVWGGTNDEAMEKVYRFFDSSYFESLEPIHGASEVLKRHQSFFQFVCVTSRQYDIIEQTKAWIGNHFPGIVDEILFGNHWTRDAPDPDHLTENKRTKREMCNSIGAVALIDDSLKYASQCSAELGPQGFSVALFGEYAWNRGETPSAAVRTKDWTEVDDFLHELREQHTNRAAAVRVRTVLVASLVAFTSMALLKR